MARAKGFDKEKGKRSRDPVTLGDIDNRVSTNAPIRVELADGRTRHLWVKGYFSEIGRPFRFAGVPEAMFYRELAGPSGIRTLRAVFQATLSSVLDKTT